MRPPPKVKPQAVMNVSIYHLGCEAIQSCDISLVKVNSKCWGCSTVCNLLAFPFSFSYFRLKDVMVCSNLHLCTSVTGWSKAYKELQNHPNNTCSIREMMGLRDQLLGEGRSEPAGTIICSSCILAAVQSQACCLCTQPSFSSSTEMQVWECESVPACLPLTRNSCVLGCEGWMHLQGTLAYLTQVPGKEAKPETAFMCTSKLIRLHLGWPRPILTPCDRDTVGGTRLCWNKTFELLIAQGHQLLWIHWSIPSMLNDLLIIARRQTFPLPCWAMLASQWAAGKVYSYLLPPSARTSP